MFWLNNSEQFIPVHQFSVAFQAEWKDLEQGGRAQGLEHLFSAVL